MKTHKDLIVWQKGIELVKTIYTVTNSFPVSEQFGLTAQIRRSAVSIPSNIAEGSGRDSEKELIRFLYIALGSASELETQLIISEKLNFIQKDKVNQLTESVVEIIKMISSLITNLKTRLNIKNNY